jgi:hypothetical protein
MIDACLLKPLSESITLFSVLSSPKIRFARAGGATFTRTMPEAARPHWHSLNSPVAGAKSIEDDEFFAYPQWMRSGDCNSRAPWLDALRELDIHAQHFRTREFVRRAVGISSCSQREALGRMDVAG